MSELPDERLTEAASVTMNYGPGAALRRKREEYGWSVEAVADSLNLPVSYLHALEDDRYDDLPGSTYIIGYWRAYARVLGMDFEDTIEANKRNVLEKIAQDVVIASQEGVRAPRAQVARASAPGSSPVLSLVLGLFGLLLVGGGLWFAWQSGLLNGSGGTVDQEVTLSDSQVDEAAAAQAENEAEAVLAPVESSVDATAVEPREQQAAPDATEEVARDTIRLSELSSDGVANSAGDLAAGVTQQATNLAQNVADSNAGTAQSEAGAMTSVASTEGSLRDAEPETPVTGDETDGDREAVVVALDEPPAAAQPEEPSASSSSDAQNDSLALSSADNPGLLSLQVERPSWLEIRDKTQKRLVYRNAATGESVQVRGTPPFYLYVAPPNGVKVSYLGKDVPVAPHTSENGVFARFRLGESVNASNASAATSAQ